MPGSAVKRNSCNSAQKYPELCRRRALLRLRGVIVGNFVTRSADLRRALTQDCATIATGGFRMMDDPNLSDEEAFWLMRLLRSRPRYGPLVQLTIPAEVHNSLLEMGLIQWRRQQVEITLDGIRAIGRRRPQEE
jgi:hypothetical protein